LRTTVIIDYQNVHLVARNIFGQGGASHQSLVHPFLYASELITARNLMQQPGHSLAILSKVLVYRGLPNPDHHPAPYRRNLAQQIEWQQNPLVTVTLKPLKYTYKRDASGWKERDASGAFIVEGMREKGIDVLCALALVREARNPDIDAVIICSQDTDLVPALDEALSLRAAKIETASWYDPLQSHVSHQIRPTGRAVWNTPLGVNVFAASLDVMVYP
jgi:uncharacterized LabA/DUF88 family protein